jgi:hypothetical protein
LISIANIELPENETLKIDYDFEPKILFNKPAITGRLHKEFLFTQADEDLGDFQTVDVRRVFKFTILGLSKATYDSLKALDGHKTTITFDMPTFKEMFEGNFKATFFKYNENVWFDAMNVQFTVVKKLPKPTSIMWIGFEITPPVAPNNSIMWIGEQI